LGVSYERMVFSEDERSLESKSTCTDTEPSHELNDCSTIAADGRRTGIKRGSSKREHGRMADHQLEEDHLCQERAYELEKMREEELLSFKDWHRRIKAARLRGNARQRKTKREQDEQKAMEAARCFAEPIRPKPPLPKKLVSL
uniref:PEHE domain-containing protein n=1 Tax=Haemonchus placei TaxID=6290 RepID=A0A0N4W5P7_HAEPC